MSVTVGLPDAIGLDFFCDSHHLVNALWREAPFTRLPPDAPAELKHYVEEIRDPRRSYSVHRASRRHDFQELVARFVIQLRRGCGDRSCDVSSCFTCRSRVAGTKPIRRYSATSARILAVYMAGCENPYDHLCPCLRNSNPTAADAKPESKQQPCSPLLPVDIARRKVRAEAHHGERASGANKLKIQVHRPSTRRQASHCQARSGDQEPTFAKQKLPKSYISISDQPVTRDYRSFAAATFETVAFKMVQWLTPGGIHALSAAVSGLLNLQYDDSGLGGLDVSQLNLPQSAMASQRPASIYTSLQSDSRATGHVAYSTQPGMTEANHAQNFRNGVGYISKAERRRSTGSMMLSRTIDGGLNSKFCRYERREDRNHHAIIEGEVSVGHRGCCAPEEPLHHPPHSPCSNSQLTLREAGSLHHRATETNVPDPEQSRDRERIEPQTLRCLNPTIVEFICDVYTEDGTTDRQHPFTSDATNYGPASAVSDLRLIRLSGDQSYRHALSWKRFNDQAIFSVLSDPRALLSSFTRDGKLFDSQTLWYCMVRLTRVTPDLVFHSLWIAAKDLLNAPEDLHRKPDNKPIYQQGHPPLTQLDAGNLMAICFHALVAAVPVVADSRTLYELSRIRASGQTWSVSAGAKQNQSLSLEYDDVFSCDLALRLARRLFLAIAAGRRYADLRERRGQSSMQGGRDALLQPLLVQLDFMNNEPSTFLEFTPADRLLHETRVPTLLLDWARAVLMTGWEGQPYFPEDSAFGGAMAFISTMYQRRNSLLLGDIQFRVDYFSERLDSVAIPVSWASPRSPSGVGHILDYPFLFTSDTLVSFFRSINFARMSKTYEESSSLQSRMEAIVRPGSLITNPHHKFVLQDLLRTASAKYLILDIGRKTVLRDAFDQLWRREQRELLRPLKVHLGEDAGEEGFDSGGVQQEFFRMAVSDSLDPVYGAFSVDERTRMAWFVPGSIVELWRFELMGVLVSLALFNGLTLPVTFPRALYRKLLGCPVTELHHIADGWPDLVSGLTALLEWDESNGPVEDVFARTYDFSVSAFDRYVSRDMKQPNQIWPSPISSSSLPETTEEGPLVTNENRVEYVNDYIRYLTDVSIRPQFEAFEKGFRRCLCPKSLKLLSPSILQSLVEGIQDIDILELRRNTRYVGWDASHRTVKDFWSIVKKYDLDMRRRLLEFVTASGRVPVGGMRNMQFVIQKNGEEEGDKGRLPTAYTCYGTLLLPEYADKDILKERLGMALDNAQGFGFA
ncbi:hypothetical protein NLU13_7242 [Sarocladium strictum]|uniref:HECT-type E3 ubiquitin transferase n=1 Tax=Sarocladium strictum TaxID=5046 RepID=A0AA39GD55_SARSR|nr:hypothetical protein NLU13_7242 [Sarocladium strictum]